MLEIDTKQDINLLKHQVQNGKSKNHDLNFAAVSKQQREGVLD